MSKELDEERELATELDLMEYRTMPVSELALAIIERTSWGQRVQAQREALEEIQTLMWVIAQEMDGQIRQYLGDEPADAALRLGVDHGGDIYARAV